MSIKITEKADYSYLFNSINSSNNNGSSMYGLNLSDYASIKNGSYGKLLKAYYTKQDSTAKSTATKEKKDTTSTAVSQLNAVSTSATKLQESASKLIDKGSKSLFKEKEITTKNSDGTTTTEMGYDKDAIYAAVKDFADQYNSFIKTADATSSTSIKRQNSNLINLVSNYKQSLNKVGITINTDNSLSVDEKKIKEADITSLKTLFNGNTSFTYSAATKASLIGTGAASEANTTKSYTNKGNYSDIYSSGNILNSIV